MRRKASKNLIEVATLDQNISFSIKVIKLPNDGVGFFSEIQSRLLSLSGKEGNHSVAAINKKDRTASPLSSVGALLDHGNTRHHNSF